MPDPKKAKRAELAGMFKEAKEILHMGDADFAHTIGYPSSTRHRLTRKLNGHAEWNPGELEAAMQKIADTLNKRAAALQAKAASIASFQIETPTA